MEEHELPLALFLTLLLAACVGVKRHALPETHLPFFGIPALSFCHIGLLYGMN